MGHLTQNGREVEDRILRVVKQDMHPGIAVANVLRLLAENNPSECLSKWGNLVKLATVNQDLTKITIEGVEHTIRLVDVPADGRQFSSERCLAVKPIGGRENDEDYFILNPHPRNQTRERLVVPVSVDRREFAANLNGILDYCRTSRLDYLEGMRFEE